MRLFERFDNIERSFDNIETRMNKQSTEWLKATANQSIQIVSGVLDDHILQSQAKHNEFQSSIE